MDAQHEIPATGKVFDENEVDQRAAIMLGEVGRFR
jgi:hypothetical protein